MSGEALIDPKNRMEQLSKSYVHAVASYCGYGADVPSVDHDSIDITISSSAGKKARIDVQLKATGQIQINDEESFSFALPIKNYNDLRADTINPRILIVFHMPTDQKEWLRHTSEELALRKCAFWVSLQGRAETTNKETISIAVPTANIFSPDCLHNLMRKADGRDAL